MKILLLGINYAPEKVGIAIYTARMAEALVEQGHEVEVVAARPYYPGWRLMDGHSGLAYRWCHCSHWPCVPTCATGRAAYPLMWG